MNVFTKEELEFILDGTRYWSNQNITSPWVFEFKEKVESLIDNCDAKIINVWHCEKCGHVQ